MNKILLIGNSGLKTGAFDGQSSKVNLYHKKIIDEGFDVAFIDLSYFTKKPFSTLIKIAKNIKKCDRIILVTAERGCKLLIPFINWCNNTKKPFVLPMIGTNILHETMDKLTTEQKIRFLNDGEFNHYKPRKSVKRNLSKLTYILSETDIIGYVVSHFFGLNNVVTLNNFRDNFTPKKRENDGHVLRLVYISRVMREKGIFDLIESVNEVNKSGNKLISLDIFGNLSLSQEDQLLFTSAECSNITYKGTLPFNQVTGKLAEYDLFAFPTRFVGEGTPGVIVESLLAGTPIITSDFPQAKYLLNDGYDSLFYKMHDSESLKNKLLYVINNKNILVDLEKGAIETGKKYTYEHERSIFLKYVCGYEKKT